MFTEDKDHVLMKQLKLIQFLCKHNHMESVQRNSFAKQEKTAHFKGEFQLSFKLHYGQRSRNETFLYSFILTLEPSNTHLRKRISILSPKLPLYC